MSKFTQTKKFKQNQKTVGLQTSLNFMPPTSSLESKKRIYESVGNLTQSMQDTDGAMNDFGSDNDEFSSNKDSDSDYEPNNDLDYYSSDEDAQPQFRKMEPFQERSGPHKKETKYIVFHNQLLLLLSMCPFCLSTAVSHLFFERWHVSCFILVFTLQIHLGMVQSAKNQGVYCS